MVCCFYQGASSSCWEYAPVVGDPTHEMYQSSFFLSFVGCVIDLLPHLVHFSLRFERNPSRRALLWWRPCTSVNLVPCCIATMAIANFASTREWPDQWNTPRALESLISIFQKSVACLFDSDVLRVTRLNICLFRIDNLSISENIAVMISILIVLRIVLLIALKFYAAKRWL